MYLPHIHVNIFFILSLGDFLWMFIQLNKNAE
jgi:hypothetical protein